MKSIGAGGRLALVVAVTLGGIGCGGESPVSPPPPPPPPATLPMTGQAVPQLAEMDRAITQLMIDWKIPGGAVAVTHQGRLVYARGFGYADTVSKRLAAPELLFRIASVSKPITAVAIASLIESGALAGDDPAFQWLADITPANNGTPDSRLGSITVDQLLWHTGGWDIDRSGEPYAQSQAIATSLGIPGPPTARQLIGFVIGRPLDFPPGGRYAYYNLGYTMAGRIIEAASRMTYETYVQSLLAKAGIRRMKIGRTRLALRDPDEVRYYDPLSAPSVFPDEGVLPFADAGVYLESADAAGGWIASVVDLARFLTAVDGSPTRPDMLGQAALSAMLRRPPRLWDGSADYYAQGWFVRPNFENWLHNGSTPGTAAFATRVGPDLTIAAVFNARAMVPGSQFELLIEPALRRGTAVTNWPTGDQFNQFP